jgi:hypothetical protein
MTWLNPIALVGLLAVMLPIFVHLFGRRVAKRQPFPSLRLLQLASTTPVTRSQPSDLLLLLVRCAIISAAALALAQPRWSSPDRRQRLQTPVRAVIVDTSRSMERLTSDGRSATAYARELSSAILDSARQGMLVETARPGANISAAASWLDQRSGKRELVVISDFQHGAVSDGDFASIPDDVGITLSKVTWASVSPSANASGIVVMLDGPSTDAQWQVRNGDTIETSLKVLAGSDSDVRALTNVVRQLVPLVTPTHAIAVVFPDYPESAQLAAHSHPLNQPWQGDFLLALRDEELVRNGRSPSAPTPSCVAAGTTPVHSANGQLLAGVAAGESGFEFELVVFSCADAKTSAGAALLTAVTRAAIANPGWDESETVVVPDERLRRWERPATVVEPRGRDETSPDGRWLWLLALLLLGVEEWLRRRTPRRTGEAVPVERRERVA